MNEKEKRQNALLAIVDAGGVGSQDELRGLLSAEGIDVTQATLSRDLKELGIVKLHRPGDGYCYVRSRRRAAPPSDTSALAGQLLVGVRSLSLSGQIGVIKTRPGHASAVAAVIDNRLGDAIMGTVAGDDTILVILRKEDDGSALTGGLREFIPDIDDKIL